MGDPDPGSDRRMAARSRHCRFWSSAVTGPGIRVIELHVLGFQVQLLSINVGRRWPPSTSCRNPANAVHWRVERTITVVHRNGSVNRCGQQDLIRSSKYLLLSLSQVLKPVLGTTAALWRSHTSRRPPGPVQNRKVTP